MMTRRGTLAGLLALATVAAAGMPAMAEARYPLPENLTPAFLREMAARARSQNPESAAIVNYYGFAATAYFRERFAMEAEIFDRMATQLEPYEPLENEMWRRDRELIDRHGVKL